MAVHTKKATRPAITRAPPRTSPPYRMFQFTFRSYIRMSCSTRANVGDIAIGVLARVGRREGPPPATNATAMTTRPAGGDRGPRAPGGGAAAAGAGGGAGRDTT